MNEANIEMKWPRPVGANYVIGRCDLMGWGDGHDRNGHQVGIWRIADSRMVACCPDPEAAAAAARLLGS